LHAAQVGGQNCTVLRQDGATGAISTVVLRASTDNLLDDLERAVDDGVNAYKVGEPDKPNGLAKPSHACVHQTCQEKHGEDVI
jgi:hypothetical protein